VAAVLPWGPSAGVWAGASCERSHPVLGSPPASVWGVSHPPFPSELCAFPPWPWHILPPPPQPKVLSLLSVGHGGLSPSCAFLQRASLSLFLQGAGLGLGLTHVSLPCSGGCQGGRPTEKVHQCLSLAWGPHLALSLAGREGQTHVRVERGRGWQMSPYRGPLDAWV
jgi:hypothetical protein